MSGKSKTFPLTISNEAHKQLTANGKAVGISLNGVCRNIIYHYLMKYDGDFLPLLTSENYNKNHAIKKPVYLPEDFWHFLANTGQPSKFIFDAIREKRERDFPNCKKREGVKYGQKK